MNDREYLYLKRKILSLTSIDIGNYKSHQMRRRLDMFVSRTQASNIVSYCRMLERDEDLRKRLQNFLTINVSEFFRDFSQFEQLRTYILPALLRNKPSLNIWSAGCSYGAEPYSIAIVLEELSPHRRHRILATDIDEGSLIRARAGGPYNSTDTKNVSNRLLRKYFTGSHGEYRIVDSLKQRVAFKQHNLLCDEFESGFDLVVCRNVTIYFTNEAKDELNRRFYRSLKDGGVLFIGGTEIMLGTNNMGFRKIGTSFYQKSPTSTSAPFLGRTPVLSGATREFNCPASLKAG